MDDIRADPIGFRSLVEGQPTSSAPLVSVSQRPIVPVEQKPVTALRCICQNQHLPRAAGHGGDWMGDRKCPPPATPSHNHLDRELSHSHHSQLPGSMPVCMSGGGKGGVCVCAYSNVFGTWRRRRRGGVGSGMEPYEFTVLRDRDIKRPRYHVLVHSP